MLLIVKEVFPPLELLEQVLQSQVMAKLQAKKVCKNHHPSSKQAVLMIIILPVTLQQLAIIE